MNLNDDSLLKTSSYINGKWQSTAETFDVDNPADGSIVASITEVSLKQLNSAVDSAEIAQKKWAANTVKERSKILMNWYQLITDNIQDLAIIMTFEQGKPIKESVSEITNAASYVEWFAEQAKRVYGDVIPSQSNDRRQLTVLQPIGVVSAITPWNFPTGMIARKAAPAIAAGCSFIVKPSEHTPLSALALAVLAERAGIPKGVFNVVVGTQSQRIGEVLTQHPKIRKFTFTGSTTIGKKLLAQCASTVKKASLELGGNAPLIVFDDADIDQAVQETMGSKFRNAGQTCVCANRIFVQQAVYNKFIEKMSVQISALKVANGVDDLTEVGPLINVAAVEKVQALIDDAITNGAKLVIGGEVDESLGPLFYKPTLIADINTKMEIAKSEIFGPVASIIPFDTEQQAIAMANDTSYGLAAYFFSKDLSRTWRISEALEYGMVGVNVGMLTAVQAPFGGIKESGLGREGSHHGLDDFLEMKYICMGSL
ncbi:MAG: succinate-semialdehyde dehydrogenase/glutarate-semialdehyde dehydrogenase [Enterobacterales bacterium]|jgi:succinate-semialdehyde dehydrogenase/glutarate-semialdehyde dehydrogenase